MTAPVTRSTLTCPACGFSDPLVMPEDACVYFHVCGRCAARLRPKPGDCCVFCSYGDVPCPPIQQDATCCASEPGGR